MSSEFEPPVVVGSGSMRIGPADETGGWVDIGTTGALFIPDPEPDADLSPVGPLLTTQSLEVEFTTAGWENEQFEVLFGGLPLCWRRLPARGEN